MKWLDITSAFAILAYVTIAILFVLRSKKEKIHKTMSARIC